MDDVSTAAPRSRTRLTLATVLCWVPPAIAIVFTVIWGRLLSVDLPTRWNGDEIVSTMPGWLVALGAIVIGGGCSMLATSALRNADASPAAVIFSAGFAAVATGVWIFVGSASVADDADPRISPLALISPLLVLWGLLPWALGRARRRASVEV
ncbi:hypothetical protein ACFWN7_13135 [Agromyces sp. NPDC058484]|uniref:hypothetical protein n=1 Tax=Agromyces sp. NPDC058484 TaxID=3346524 RepID=UPI00365F19B8